MSVPESACQHPATALFTVLIKGNELILDWCTVCGGLRLRVEHAGSSAFLLPWNPSQDARFLRWMRAVAPETMRTWHQHFIDVKGKVV